jgi:hypothetical protein
MEVCSKCFRCHCVITCFAQVITSSSKGKWCDGQQVNNYANLFTLIDQFKVEEDYWWIYTMECLEVCIAQTYGEEFWC